VVFLAWIGWVLAAGAQSYSLKGFSLSRSGSSGEGGRYAVQLRPLVFHAATSDGSWAVVAVASSAHTSPLLSKEHPIPFPDTLGTSENKVASISVRKLLANDRDPDGDELIVSSVDPSSSYGGTVSLILGVVHYTPPSGFVGSDWFRYTVSDAWSSATSEVRVTVRSGEQGPLNIVSGPRMVSGHFRVTFAAIPGSRYAIQAASNLAGPWTTVTTQIVPVSGVFEFVDPTESSEPMRFYRTVELP